jgi:hypothetical protein
MFRNTILSAALALGAFAGLSVTPATADAHPPVGHGRPDRFGRFEVLVRHRGHWDKYGTYRDRDDARRAARQLRQRGYDVKIERC